MSAYPGRTSADLYRYAHAALRDARGWTEVRVPPPMAPEHARALEGRRSFAVCALLVEADELRALARRRRPPYIESTAAAYVAARTERDGLLGAEVPATLARLAGLGVSRG